MVNGDQAPSDKNRSNENLATTQRRTFLKETATGGAAISFGLAGCMSTFSGGDEGPIKIGSLSDRSGELAVYGGPMTKATQLAVDQINDDGGLLGRDVKLINPDPQSSNQQYKDLAQKLILEDEVDVLLGGISSASREAIRPIVNENKQLYFYPALYEGGVCDEYTYLTGPVPTQQIRPLVEYMIEEFGPNCYTMAADYNFGQLSALWTRRYLDEFGGNLAGEEFIPLSVSDFGSSINRIQNEDPDWIMSFLVGANHVQFFKEADSTGLKKPMGSSVQVGASFEHKTLSASVLENMHVSFNYVQELKTERNQAFVQEFMDKYPDTEYINQHAQSQYMSLQFWQKAVEQAETVNQKDVGAQLEEGIEIDAPEGDAAIDPSTHHTNHDIHLLRVTQDHSLEEIKTIEGITAEWLAERCELASSESTWENPTSKQLTPETNSS